MASECHKVSSRLISDENNPPVFIKGLELSEDYFNKIISPLITKKYPQLKYSAGLIGSGSEVFGFDDPVSTDHDWAPKVLLFLSDDDFIKYESKLRELFMNELPTLFRGFPTRMWARNVKHAWERQNIKIGDPRLEPNIEIYTLKSYFMKVIDIDITQPIRTFDWLSTAQQRLAAIMAGKVYRDDIGLDEIRAKLEWYPHDIWLYMLASIWHRIGCDEQYMGRAGNAGDSVGSMIIAMRVLRDIMRLCFLLEKRYAPYPKWLGSSFMQLECANEIYPIMEDITGETDWKKREDLFMRMFVKVVKLQNELGLTPKLENEPYSFIGRPYSVIGGYGISGKLINEIKDVKIKELSEKWTIGNIDYISDNHAFDDDPRQRVFLRELYE